MTLLGSIQMQAQTTDPTRAALDNLFAPLNKSQVPTGLLAESSLSLVPLDVFNGTLTDSSRTTPDGFRYVYATLYSSLVAGTQPLRTMQDYNARITAADASFGTGTIPVMVQRVSYATVRPDAFSQNLLSYQNGQVADVNGRSQNPYLVRTAFAAAPTRVYVPSGTITLVLASSLEIQSGGAAIAGRFLDFGDGAGYRAATLDQPLSATYSATGAKRIKVRYTYTDSSSLESWFDLTVTSVTVPAMVTANNSGAKTLQAFDGRVTPIPGVRAGGTAYVRLGSGHSDITKPFIVVEGFDPGAVAPLIQPNLTVDEFLLSIQFPTRNYFFYSQLDNAGYDIIYIDYDNGTDNILLNAALFEEVLSRVNAAKVGTEQNVVLGISMGGLVARYQLADMVKNNRPTQTRLLILQDSPQHGANVPLGFQALVRQADLDFGFFKLTDVNQTLKQATTLLDQPATQQLLLYRATGPTNGFAANSFIETTYQQKVTFASGQAPPYQVIAASNGSQCGTALFNPYTEIIRGDGKIFISPLPWIVRTTYYTQVIVNALPDGGQSNRVSTLQLYSIIRLFGFINLRINYIRKDYSCPSGLLAVDGVAGGTQYVGARIPAGVLPPQGSVGFSVFAQLALNYSFVREFCFVPTASALDLNDFNQTTLQGQNVNNTSSVSFSRTNEFIAQEPFTDTNGSSYRNIFHTVFTARNSAWMFSRMQNTTLPSNYCSSECDPAAGKTISGPNILCVGGNGPATYTSPIQGQGYTYTWLASPANAFTVSSGSDPTFQTANVPGVNAGGTITLTVNTGCEIVFRKAINVGAPAAPAFYQRDPSDMCYSGTAYYTITNYDPALTYTIRAVGASGFLDPGGFRLKRSRSGYVSFTLSVSNSCGTSTADGEVEFNCDGQRSYAVYPNPAADELTVAQTDNASASRSTASTMAASTPFTVRLYDTYGALHLKQASTTPTVNLAVATLPAGLYLLRIEADGATVESRQIQITH